MVEWWECERAEKRRSTVVCLYRSVTLLVPEQTLSPPESIRSSERSHSVSGTINSTGAMKAVVA